MKTNLNRTAPTPIRLVAGVINLFAGATPERASEALVQFATSVQFADTNGQFIHGGESDNCTVHRRQRLAGESLEGQLQPRESSGNNLIIIIRRKTKTGLPVHSLPMLRRRPMSLRRRFDSPAY